MGKRLRTVRDLDVGERRVLVRVDYNVPLEHGHVVDDTRIRETLGTIEWLIERRARIILCSHLGRPKGQVREDLRLAPVARTLSTLLGRSVHYVRDIVGPEAQEMAHRLQPGEVGLLENLRFDPREEANDPVFARELANLAECYVNDAFGAAHRAHASVVGVAQLLPSAAGLLMEREVTALDRVLHSSERPFVLVLGGAKVSDKIGVIENLLPRVDALLLGGGMANTFLKARGYELGRSLVEGDKVDEARRVVAVAEQRGVRIELPVDVVIAPSIDRPDARQVVRVGEVPADHAVFDIGPETVRRFAEVIATAKMLVWNGPMGVYEVPEFRAGTRGVAEAVAQCAGFTLVGGGDSVAALRELGLADRVAHLSTGGGATLEYLEGRELPGVAVLMEEVP
ncbi:phosphoglycerate kinase [Thermomicrobium sp. 4228-Ro]|uniref:phosphoglycerate kinase n=1 Tax=Thermomicrobium sp. 4228-Ro TaxID=2993937 RepID=UPI00224906F6|nr:phosphoglycerate kinase [Thermomicrobium sp. 4228-Ro]MCX2726131.1 phosphoglycerate kinase [Thermomicrobium sp. 4228-Ro]